MRTSASPDLFHFSLIVFSLSSRRFVMLQSPVTIVDPLCRSAEDAGGKIPNTPSAMRSALKDMMNL